MDARNGGNEREELERVSTYDRSAPTELKSPV